MPIIFAQLTVILTVAAVVSLIAKRMNQPLMVGYIITGIIVGPAVLGIVQASDNLESFGEIGIAFLLFLVGLRLQPSMIRGVGIISVITGLGQVIFTCLFGYLIAKGIGFSSIEAIYLSIAFTFSSTIVILQLLYTKEEQDTLHGRIATGFMLVQDIVAMVIFLFLSSAESSSNLSMFLVTVIFKATVIMLAVYVLSQYIMPRIDKYFARSHQVLFLFALAICFLFATGFTMLGFSFELGALLAGILLSLSPYQREIASRIHTLRDFFLVMFFVVLGTYVLPSSLIDNWGWITIFSLFILIGDPLIVIILMRMFGYTLRTSFYSGLTVAQISEFSLVLIATGVGLGHIPTELYGPTTVVALITIFVSSYFIMNSRHLYDFLEPLLIKIFGTDAYCDVSSTDKAVNAIMFGCHRLGAGIIDVLESMKLNFIVVDHNPEVIHLLKSANVRSAFGSADDAAFLESLPLKQLKLVVSTIPEINTNLTLLTHIRKYNTDAIILCVANHESHAKNLYVAGATYVIIPPYLGRRYIVDLLREYQVNNQGYKKERDKHLKDLSYINGAL